MARPVVLPSEPAWHGTHDGTLEADTLLKVPSGHGIPDVELDPVGQ